VPISLNGDPGRLRQIIVNLTINAIKFTEIGSIIIRISLEKEDESYTTIKFSISDTGIGIPADRIKRLFKAFSQVDISTTRRYGGTGLGLAISKQLSELMDGKIGVESQEGKGSTFWFTATFKKQQYRPTSQSVPWDIAGKRILVVDDNPVNLEIMEGYLKQWDCRCHTASSAKEAISLLKLAADTKSPFDLAIVDHMMPQMNGEELGLFIKSNSLLKNTPLIMLTSRGLRGDAVRMRKIGFSAYLTKPLKRSQFYNCIETVMGHKKEDIEVDQSKFITKYTLIEAERKKFRILLAEDNPVNQKLALKLLEKKGYIVDIASNGKEAIEALEKNSYHLVLMDVQMPEMDGFEATHTIRDKESNVKNHDIPVIAMTAHAMKGDREKCINAGMDDYISKPIKTNELFEMLNKYLDNYLT
ncbi:MAG: response regulator, partial [Desulfobacterales bacterium]|nr:response regulator [Desulfobacterales bacterium]